MLLMSDKIKDQVAVDDLYKSNESNVDDSLYTQAQPDDDFKYEAVLSFESGKLILGVLFEIENTCPQISNETFEKIKLKFYTSPSDASAFMTGKVLSNIRAVHNNEDILNYNVDISAIITKNIKTKNNGQMVCELIVCQNHK